MGGAISMQRIAAAVAADGRTRALDAITGDMVWWGAVLGGIVLIGFVLWLVLSRRR